MRATKDKQTFFQPSDVYGTYFMKPGCVHHT